MISAVLFESSKWSIERGTGFQGQGCTTLLSLLYLRSSSRQMRVPAAPWWTGICTQCSDMQLHRHAECIRRNIQLACFQKTASCAYFFLPRVEWIVVGACRSIPSCSERILSSLLVPSSISSMRAPLLEWVKVYDTLLSSSRNRSLILSSAPRALLSLAGSYLNGLVHVTLKWGG